MRWSSQEASFGIKMTMSNRSRSGTRPAWCTGTPARCPGLSLYAAAAFTPPQAVAAAADDTINSSLCYGFVADVAAVRIDPQTLQVRIEKLSTVHDAGTVLNPALLEGQVHGAIAHALGGAFYEEMRYSDDGQPACGTFMDYLCPTAAEATFPLVSDHVRDAVAVHPAGRQGRAARAAACRCPWRWPTRSPTRSARSASS